MIVLAMHIHVGQNVRLEIINRRACRRGVSKNTPWILTVKNHCWVQLQGPPPNLGENTMRRIENLDEWIQQLEQRKQEQGITDADIDNCRNSGLRRTQEKRQSLASIRDRAIAHGLKPLDANY